MLNTQTPRIILNMQMAAEPIESRMELTTEIDITPGNDIQLTSLYDVGGISEEPRDSP